MVYPETQSRLTKAVPISLQENPSIRKKVLSHYRRDLPICSKEISSCTSPSALETATERLARTFLQPWLAHFAHKLARFRPAWTSATDQLAKQRSKLLKAQLKPDSKAAVRRLDKQIGRLVRRRRRRLQSMHLDAINDGPMSQTLAITKQVQLIRMEPDMVQELDPDTFTEFLQDQHPETDTSPLPNRFNPPSGFNRYIHSSIVTMAPNKAPGPEWITAEVLQLAPEESTAAILAIWNTVDKLAYVPKPLRSGTVVPLFRKGDSEDPRNYRPITLLLVLRKAISKAIGLVFIRSYGFHSRQLRFLLGSSMETAIVMTSDSLHIGFKYRAVLDLKSAYDRVPRDLLLELCRHRLDSSLCDMIQCLLHRTVTRKKGQLGYFVAHITLGVPQGDAFSPWLFNVFIDPLLSEINGLSDTRGIGFADDVLGLTRSWSGLTRLLAIVEE